MHFLEGVAPIMASEKTYLVYSGFHGSAPSKKGAAYRAAASVGRGVKSVLGIQKDGEKVLYVRSKINSARSRPTH